MSEIQKFYNGQIAFITGATGFLGKILVEKLLRSTNISLIYILVRQKKGKDVNSRLEEYFDDIVFERLKSECPKYFARIEGIAGDCSINGLGISVDNRQKIIKNVNIVFHLAATVKFDEHLKIAYAINVDATEFILELSRQIKNLKCMIHVSTTYSNCYSTELEEKLYDHSVDYEKVGMVLEKLSHNDVEELTPSIIGKWPNTYTFTKALAESLLKKTGNQLPLGVFRPSIVVSTYQEPLPGWINNVYGPTGLIAATYVGLLRVNYHNSYMVADLIPVDMCVSALIASAWEVSETYTEKSDYNVPVYNYVSSAENPILWGEVIHLGLVHGRRHPTKKSIWYPIVHYTKNELLFRVLYMFYNIIPALLFDVITVAVGKKPRMLKMTKKIQKLMFLLKRFSLNEWQFKNNNIQRLYEKLGDADKELFPFSMKNFSWLTFYNDYFLGIRRYLLKDPDSTFEEASAKNKKLYLLHVFIMNIFWFVVTLMLWNLFTKIMKIF